MDRKKMMAGAKKRLAKAGQKLAALRKAGVRKITLFYTREVNGKRIPNYKTVGLTAGIVALAGAGAYALYRHKKYGYVIRRKK